MARMHAEQEDFHAFRMLQQQAVTIGQQRTELWMKIADLAGPSGIVSAQITGRDPAGCSDRERCPSPRR